MKEKHKYLDFNELNKEQKKIVLDKYHYINVENFNLIIDKSLYKKLEDAGFNDPKLYWNLDGYYKVRSASFDCYSIDCKKALKNWNYHHKKWIVKILEEFCKVKTSVNHLFNNCNHERSRYIVITNTLPSIYSRIILAICSALSYIEQLRLDICCDLRNSLQDGYKRLISNKAFIKIFEVNRYYYFNEENIKS